MNGSAPNTFSAAIGIGLLVLTACGGPPPPGRVYVVDRPPHDRIEVVPVAPGREFLWIGGFWRRSGRGWDWVPGHYARHEAGRRWVAGHWAHDRRGWYFVDGRWR